MVKQSSILGKTLVLSIILLIICMSITPSVAIDNNKKPTNPISSGNTLYVGGDGPNNYTTIQDAIDNSSNGDTVFVFDDSSPYYENIRIKNSINLIGENKNTTIINGKNSYDSCIEISHYTNISGFKIQNCSSGISIGSDYNTISNNLIINNEFGIHILYTRKNTIKNNFFANNGYGISIWDSDDIIIENNYIFSNSEGIEVDDSSNNKIFNNTILENYNGIHISAFSRISKYNIVKSNNISNNRCGIYIGYSYYVTIENNNFYNNNWTGLYLESRGCTISKNNFIENQENVYFVNILNSYRKNKWDTNYWSDYKGIFGFPKIIRGKLLFGLFFNHYLPSFALDWHPASEPYDIEV